MTQRSKITQLPSTTSTKKKKYEKKNEKKRKSTKKKRKIYKKANDQKVNYPKGERAKQTTYMAEKKNKKNNGGPLLCHTIKAISRRIFSNKEQCQLLIKDYNCFKTASTD